MRGLIILGSSNSHGDTFKMTDYLRKKTGMDFVDLKSKTIGQFDYEFNNAEDDFLPLMKSIVENYDLLVFATPVYWYSMSGIMKKFFDRISDCLKTEKDIGRKLRGMKMASLSCAGQDDIIDGFYMPFVESAKYLGMPYLGDIHCYIQGNEISEEVKKRLDDFSQILK